MKTTIKFDYQSSGVGGKPIIKIVQPVSVFQNNPDLDLGELDSRDTLAREFLNPDYEPSNRIFVVKHEFGVPNGEPTHYIKIIEPIMERQFSEKMRWEFLNRYIPSPILYNLDHPVETNKTCSPSHELIHYMQVFKKFNEFFTYVDELTKPEHRVEFINNETTIS